MVWTAQQTPKMYGRCLLSGHPSAFGLERGLRAKFIGLRDSGFRVWSLGIEGSEIRGSGFRDLGASRRVLAIQVCGLWHVVLRWKRIRDVRSRM